jgi:hypothetical protein
MNLNEGDMSGQAGPPPDEGPGDPNSVLGDEHLSRQEYLPNDPNDGGDPSHQQEGVMQSPPQPLQGDPNGAGDDSPGGMDMKNQQMQMQQDPRYPPPPPQNGDPSMMGQMGHDMMQRGYPPEMHQGGEQLRALALRAGLYHPQMHHMHHQLGPPPPNPGGPPGGMHLQRGMSPYASPLGGPPQHGMPPPSQEELARFLTYDPQLLSLMAPRRGPNDPQMQPGMHPMQQMPPHQPLLSSQLFQLQQLGMMNQNPFAPQDLMGQNYQRMPPGMPGMPPPGYPGGPPHQMYPMMGGEMMDPNQKMMGGDEATEIKRVAACIQGGKRKKRRKYTHESFPQKLYRLLEETEQAGRGDVCSFTPSGQSFHVHDPDAFTNEIIPQYFRHSHFSSFQRQLSMYGFGRVRTKGPDAGAYVHPLFKRGHPKLCAEICRVSELDEANAAAAAAAAASDQGGEKPGAL